MGCILIFGNKGSVEGHLTKHVWHQDASGRSGFDEDHSVGGEIRPRHLRGLLKVTQPKVTQPAPAGSQPQGCSSSLLPLSSTPGLLV